MPVRIPDNLPAKAILANENIFVMDEGRATHQDIRPLEIAVLNLMPTKIVTETQIIRLLSNSSLQIDIAFLRMRTHDSKNTPTEHLESFYQTFDELKHRKFDGLVITGAPVEILPFEEVDYWGELREIMEWSKTNVYSTLHICWGAQAGLYHHFGVPKHPLPAKMFGVFDHRVLDPRSRLLRGFDDPFPAPHSRHTEVRLADIEKAAGLKVLAVSAEAGVYIAESADGRMVFVSGHPEYDRDTLKAEYDRDVAKGMDIAIPAHYYPGDDPTKTPTMRWRAHAHLLYANWLNYYVYQQTPFDLDRLPQVAPPR